MLNWPDKDPNEVLDYQLNWTERLDGDTIDVSTWIVPDGLVEDSSSNTTSASTIWLSGGVLGERYTLTNRVETAGGRVMDQSVRIKIKEK